MAGNKKRKESGFTLLEILICVAIISILSTISLTGYYGALDYMDIKSCVPQITNSLNHYTKRAQETKTPITVKFLMGTTKIHIYEGLDANGSEYRERDLGHTGLLKRKLHFCKYRWPNGDKSPATYTILPDGSVKGGNVYFGSAFAETKIYIIGNRIVSNAE